MILLTFYANIALFWDTQVISIFFYHQYYCNENLHPYSFFHLLNYFPKTQSQGYNYQKTLVNNDLTPAVSLNWIAHLLLLFLCEGSVIKVKLLASNLTSPQERMTWSQVTTGLQRVAVIYQTSQVPEFSVVFLVGRQQEYQVEMKNMEFLDFNPGSTAYQLCEIRQLTQHFSACFLTCKRGKIIKILTLQGSCEI